MVEESRSEQKEATRLKIFRAAMDLFRRKGVDATTVDEIVAKAGVSKGTYFFHYPSKERIFGAYVEVMTEELLPPLPGWLALSSPEGLWAVFEAITVRAERDRKFIPNLAMELLFHEDPPTGQIHKPPPNSAYADLVRNCEPSPLIAIFFPLVVKAQKDGWLRADLHPAVCIGHILSNYLVYMVWAAPHLETPLAKYLRQAMELTLNGLLAHGEQG